jgi:hypothetical protein
MKIPGIIDLSHRYDSFNRNGPKIFVGEYAKAIAGEVPSPKSPMARSLRNVADRLFPRPTLRDVKALDVIAAIDILTLRLRRTSSTFYKLV